MTPASGTIAKAVLVAVLVLVILGAAHGEQAFFVAVDGNDAWSGTLPATRIRTRRCDWSRPLEWQALTPAVLEINVTIGAASAAQSPFLPCFWQLGQRNAR
jgi:hypothetical protein